jgi:hypothetical protein
VQTIARLSVAAAFVCGFARHGLAQDASPPVADRPFYASVAFELSAQDSADRIVTDPDQPNAAVGGAALGVTATIGRHLSKLTSVAAEVSLPTRFQATQQINYLQRIQYDNRHREPTVSALMLVHTPLSHVLRPEWVFGISYVQEATLQRSASAPFSGPFGPFGPATEIERDTWALTGGINLAEPLSGRLQFVEQIRLHWVDRADINNRSDYNSAVLYLSPLVFRAGVGLRVLF